MNTLLLTAYAPSDFWNLKTGEDLMWVVLLLIIGLCTLLILAVTVYLAIMLQKALNPAPPQAVGAPKRTFWQKVTGLHSLNQEHELAMEHAYDGIVELNNPTPPWFMFLFYGTIAFGVVYLIAYHLVNPGDIMNQEYQEEVALAEKQREVYLKQVAGKINENNVAVLTDAKAIESGKALYTTYCTACHGAKGEGIVGPNLTDEYWIHGGNIKALFHTITEGVPEKGMVSWKKQLNPLQVQQVSSFILSLKGTNPPNGKAPQGEKEANPVAMK